MPFVRKNKLPYSAIVVNFDPFSYQRGTVIVGVGSTRCIWTMSDPVSRGALSKSSQRGIFLCFCIQVLTAPVNIPTTGPHILLCVCQHHCFVCLFYFVSMHRSDSSSISMTVSHKVRVIFLKFRWSAIAICRCVKHTSCYFCNVLLREILQELLFRVFCCCFFSYLITIWIICLHFGQNIMHNFHLKPLTFFCLLFQNMDKAQLPSVTLIVGCGVSSLTLLLLIIIYVSVWR